MMNRRTFLYGLTLETLSAPLTIEAQQVAKTAQIGFLSAGVASFFDRHRRMTHVNQALRGGLAEFGCVEDQTVTILSSPRCALS